MLLALVGLYLAASIAVGLYAATRVRGAADFAVAGGRFGAPVVAATVFATWFGAETVLGIPATFFKEGLRGLVADPFAAVGCLVLVGLVFARPLFRLDVLTLGDFFRDRFDRKTDIALSSCIAFSYLGWIAAQLVALGLVFNVLSGGSIDTRTGIVAGAAIVLIYTMAGGMWSVALTDFVQALMIIVGMLYVAWVVADLAGGAGRVWHDVAATDRLRFLPDADAKSVLGWISAALVVLLGSVPQQDVLQRVKSARDERTAVVASVAGGIVYLAIALVPIFLVCAAAVIDPGMVERLVARDPQLILPTLIAERTPIAVQALFFGALVAAILSTAGGALLAPAVMLAENVARPIVRPDTDAALLRIMRVTVALLAVAVTVIALTSTLSIYQLVNESGKVVLVSSFVPLAAGLFWKRATARGAHASIAAGLGVWMAMEWLAPEALVPPPLAGLIASAAAMAAGSLLSRR
ncbi:MAG TPA: sodium:solute symporter family protein [Usitatibacter sp.]|nr:sodium:solute symporter family protein [Usitatibacter sp.]